MAVPIENVCGSYTDLTTPQIWCKVETKVRLLISSIIGGEAKEKSIFL
jgi:hypothetical protein